MNIIYGGEDLDINVESIYLNGQPGAVNITDAEEDLDITFEDMDTALEWTEALLRELVHLRDQQ